MHRIREAVGLKLCAAQMDIAWENKAENLKKCSVLAEQAASNGAQLIVFPELTLTGFSMNKDLSEPPDGDSVNQFMRLSEKIGIAAGFGFACRTGSTKGDKLPVGTVLLEKRCVGRIDTGCHLLR